MEAIEFFDGELGGLLGGLGHTPPAAMEAIEFFDGEPANVNLARSPRRAAPQWRPSSSSMASRLQGCC